MEEEKNSEWHPLIDLKRALLVFFFNRWAVGFDEVNVILTRGAAGWRRHLMSTPCNKKREGKGLVKNKNVMGFGRPAPEEPTVQISAENVPSWYFKSCCQLWKSVVVYLNFHVKTLAATVYLLWCWTKRLKSWFIVILPLLLKTKTPEPCCFWLYWRTFCSLLIVHTKKHLRPQQQPPAACIRPRKTQYWSPRNEKIYIMNISLVDVYLYLRGSLQGQVVNNEWGAMICSAGAIWRMSGSTLFLTQGCRVYTIAAEFSKKQIPSWKAVKREFLFKGKWKFREWAWPVRQIRSADLLELEYNK